MIADASEDYADIGKCTEIANLNGERVLAGLHTFLARPDKAPIALGFTSFLVHSWFVRKQVLTIAQGSKVISLSTKRLAKVKLPIPTLPEQQKIANFLASIDQKISLLEEKKQQLEAFKKGMMQQLFSQQLRFKDENGEDFPAWEVKKLETIAHKVNSKNKDNKFSFVLTNSATQGIISQQAYFDKEIANKNNLGGYYIVSINDFVYNPRISAFAPVGPIKRNKFRQGVMSPLYTVFRFTTGNLDYLEYFFEATTWYKYMHSVANFGVRHDRMNISSNNFNKMPIPFPSLREQDKIASYLNKLSQQIQNIQEQLTQNEAYKKGLLQQLLV